MAETQNIEYKKIWKDEFLVSVCAFANSQGGKLYIGIDDKGNISPLTNPKKLMEALPEKIKNRLGVVSEVNLLGLPEKNYIEIVTQPYSVPIYYRGKLYVRSGTTNQELTGNTLTDFLLKKSGRTWDDIIEERATFADIDKDSIDLFLSDASKSEYKRLPDAENISHEELLEKLFIAEEGRIKRAAVVLFGKNPGRFYSNTFVKIGKFGKDDEDLIANETVEGNLIQLLRRITEQLNNKFLSHRIEFEGLQRIEKGEYPVAAIREMMLNALVHRNYFGAPTQIKIYPEKFSIWNEGLLPENMDLESLKRSHRSRPRNPRIAHVCYNAGYIDSWGRGTLKIIKSCKEAELPEPDIHEIDGGIQVTIYKTIYSTEKLMEMGLNERQIKAIEFVKEKGSITNTDYQNLNSVSRATASRDLSDLVDKFNIFIKIGEVGQGTNYSLNEKGS